MKTYRVTVQVTCFVTYEIEEESKQAARNEAMAQAESGDLGSADDISNVQDLKVIDCEIVSTD